MFEQHAVDEVHAVPSRFDDAARSVIYITAGEKPRIVDQVMEVIRSDLFHRDGRLVTVRIADGEHTLASLSREALDDLINRRCEFVAFDKKGNEVRLDSPKWVAETIHGLGEWPPFREIRQVTAAPFLRPDGSVGGLEQGYDAASKVWADAPDGLSPPPEKPTDEQAKAALDVLLDVVSEFPFASPASTAVYVAGILTIAARRYIAGAVPLFLIDASKSGSGKTLLARIMAAIGTGADPGLANTGSNESEFRKSVTSFLMSGQPVMILDNQIGKLGGEAIDRLQTAGKWTDRLLNHNRVVTLKNDIVTIVTSNNSTVYGDTARRTLSIRLVPDCENPEYREFRRKDLLRHVRQHRAELAVAALTILRWHIGKGCPEAVVAERVTPEGHLEEAAVRAFGSFEAWSRCVRHAVIQLGLPDPVATQAAVRELDEQAIGERRFVAALADWKPDWRGTAEELVRAVTAGEAPVEVRLALDGILGEKDFEAGGPRPKSVGYKLRALKDRRFGSWAITVQGDCRNGVRWGLQQRGDAEMPPGPPKGISASGKA
jgi:putative DNA primase/helicase